MALLLNIDTATETAIVSISDNEKVLASVINSNQKDHAAFLHTSIKHLLQEAGVNITQLNAVAVSAGPGSYTGLRVGMATTKGLCYALNIPLITINTLEVIAKSAIDNAKDISALYCPMIDARRMEVFTAIYDHYLNEIVKPAAMILDDASFNDLSQKIYCNGSGSLKFKNITGSKNMIFTDAGITAEAMAKLSFKKYNNQELADVAYASPLYLKEVYTK